MNCVEAERKSATNEAMRFLSSYILITSRLRLVIHQYSPFGSNSAAYRYDAYLYCRLPYCNPK
jgi:hypothetical protein